MKKIIILSLLFVACNNSPVEKSEPTEIVSNLVEDQPIDPLSIIMDMRQYLVMEQSSAPTELNVMMSNIENNGAPWPFNQQDRLNWSKE